MTARISINKVHFPVTTLGYGKRVGIWPDYFPGVQFSKDPEALNQYFRQMTPNVGPYDPEGSGLRTDQFESTRSIGVIPSVARDLWGRSVDPSLRSG